MPQEIQVIGRVRLLQKNGRRYHYEVSARDATLLPATHWRRYCGADLHLERLRLQERPPVEPPPNEPKKPPIEEPEDPPEPPPPNRPPVKEPPNDPDAPPVKEPPPKDPDREPPQKPPVRAV